MPVVTIDKPEKEELGLIYGKKAASSWEWMVAKSLWKFGWEFEYQVGVAGGRMLRGGQVIDFLVNTHPLPTPLYIQGDFWHGALTQDKDLLLIAFLMSDLAGRVAMPVVLTGEQLADQETTDQTILKTFGRAN